MSDHEKYLWDHSWHYRDAVRRGRMGQKSAASYKEKYLDLRKAVRLYFKGEMTEADLKKLAGWKS